MSLLLLLIGMPVIGASRQLELEFNALTNRDGLSNAQVNCILQDSKGYIWLGTQSGLDRYDGFRFKNFFNKNLDASTLSNNSVDEIQQDAKGNLWVHTSVGYCVYLYDKETFDRKPEVWLKNVGVGGAPYRVFVDSNKNMWFVVYGQGCYFLNMKTMQSHLFTFKEMGVTDKDEVNSITDQHGTVVLSFRNATLCRLDGLHKKVLWVNSHLTKTYHFAELGAYTYIDSRNNYWVLTNGNAYIYSSIQKKWYVGMSDFLKGQGISMPTSMKVLIRDIAKAKDGKLWIATDHTGLLIVDYAKKTCKQYVKLDGVPGALTDNRLQSVYIDRSGGVWIGTYKNGVVYYSPSFAKFNTIPLGDICTITQDKQGNYWCGTDDSGIVSYNPKTGQRQSYGKAQTGLNSDVVVSSITMSDGTMYFGTFKGGMVRYRNGQWKTYANSSIELGHQSVWAFAEDKNHRLLIGTLGGGVMILDPRTDRLVKTLNISNSKIPSDYISSFCNLPNGKMLIGHSMNMSILDVDNFNLTNLSTTKEGMPFPSPSINDIIADSRGIYWMATPAGMTMYDPKNGQVELVNELNGTQGSIGCSVIEDQAKNIWLISEFIVTRVKLTKDHSNQWELNMTSYNAMDGLQDRQFNYRSAFLSANGDLVIGGQDGINIIHTQAERSSKRHVKALFSGLVLFEHPLSAGEEYEGRVILNRSLDDSRRLDLSYKDNAFTIQLSSSEVMAPSRNRFLYRMVGVNDKWLMTASGHPEVTFTNLSSGSYTLQVKVVNGDGTVCDDISELEINVNPPFYLSIWAMMIYILLACGTVYLFRKRALDKQKMLFEREKMEENIRKDRELNELKLSFFTNLSHELRTPLTLIISPLVSMIRKENDGDKKRKLELIHRNATRLLKLVNQILDFRKIEQDREKLNLARVEVVSYVENICTSFQLLGNNKITLMFESKMPQFVMMFDVDKVGKIVNNLLSNAYKFTPDGGRVTVSLDVLKDQHINEVLKDVLRIRVADTGKGISDADKARIFDRFYQVNCTEMQPFGGSGIGLNLVKSFADMHGGTVFVEDNPGGGTIFIVDIPTNQGEESAEAIPVQKEIVAEQAVDESAVSPATTAVISEKPVILLVDDSDDFREFMRDVLSENYIVVEATNGKEGWDALQKEPRPDIILSDVMMPVMDGNQFCRLVKNSSLFADIPFVMLTARMASEHKKEGFENGADEYITKPFDVDLLSVRIKNMIGRARSVAAHQATPVASDQESKQNLEYVLTAADKRFLEKVDIYIRDNMGDPDTSVESLSAHLCISRVQLYKKMVSFTGTTPSEYLRAKRIHWAEQLLLEGELTVSEIAYKVGFNNPRYFSKYFQEEYGMTPTQYRKTHM